MYAIMRRDDPVHRAQTGEYIISRYNDIREILKSPAFESGNRLTWLKKGIQYFDSKQEDFRAIHQAMNSFVLMLNDGQHLRMTGYPAKPRSMSWSAR